MKSRALFPLVASACGVLGLLAAAGCEDESGGGGPPVIGGVDANLPDTATSTDTGVPGNDGGGSDSSSGDDSGSSVPISSCAAPLRVDTLRGVNGSVTIDAASFGNKWVVQWFQNASVSGDNLDHMKARYFDGAALAPEIDLGTDNFGLKDRFVSDGNGRAFLQRYVGPNGSRHVFDFATGTFTSSTFTTVNNFYENFSIAALPNGGALSLYRDGTNVLADRWLPATPTWTPTGLTGVPASSFGLRISTNAAGKAVGMWLSSDGTGTTINLATFDGTTWATPTTKLLPTADGTVSGVVIAALANGDAEILYTQGAESILKAMRYKVAGSTFDPATEIGNTRGSSGTASFVVDGSDRMSAAWIDNGKIMARRNLGAGWLPVQDLGTSIGVRLDVDPKTSNVALTSYLLPTLGIRAITGATTAWPATATTLNLGITNQTYPQRQAAVTFDGAGHPTVFSMQDIAGAGGLALYYAACK